MTSMCSYRFTSASWNSRSPAPEVDEEPPGAEREHPPQHPGRHRETEEAPVDLAALARPGQDLGEHFPERQYLEHVVEARTAFRDRTRRLRRDPNMPRGDRGSGRGHERDDRSPGDGRTTAGPMQRCTQEYHSGRKDGNPLQDAERTRGKPEHVLAVERETKQSGADREAHEVRGSPDPEVSALLRRHRAEPARAASAEASCCSTSSIARWRTSLPSTM